MTAAQAFGPRSARGAWSARADGAVAKTSAIDTASERIGPPPSSGSVVPAIVFRPGLGAYRPNGATRGGASTRPSCGLGLGADDSAQSIGLIRWEEKPARPAARV